MSCLLGSARYRSRHFEREGGCIRGRWRNQGYWTCGVEYPILTPRIGYAEQDPEQWWRATITAVRQALAEADHPEIVGIGFSGQMHGLVLLDQRKNLVRPAITPSYGDRHQLGSSLCVFGTRSQQVCNCRFAKLLKECGNLKSAEEIDHVETNYKRSNLRSGYRDNACLFRARRGAAEDRHGGHV
jgi:hypothetical protein